MDVHIAISHRLPLTHLGLLSDCEHIVTHLLEFTKTENCELCIISVTSLCSRRAAAANACQS